MLTENKESSLIKQTAMLTINAYEAIMVRSLYLKEQWCNQQIDEARSLCLVTFLRLKKAYKWSNVSSDLQIFRKQRVRKLFAKFQSSPIFFCQKWNDRGFRSKEEAMTRKRKKKNRRKSTSPLQQQSNFHSYVFLMTSWAEYWKVKKIFAVIILSPFLCRYCYVFVSHRMLQSDAVPLKVRFYNVLRERRG